MCKHGCYIVVQVVAPVAGVSCDLYAHQTGEHETVLSVCPLHGSSHSLLCCYAFSYIYVGHSVLGYIDLKPGSPLFYKENELWMNLFHVTLMERERERDGEWAWIETNTIDIIMTQCFSLWPLSLLPSKYVPQGSMRISNIIFNSNGSSVARGGGLGGPLPPLFSRRLLYKNK